MKAQTVHMTDKMLRDAVIAQLDFVPEVDPTGIGVAVEDGVVTLSGHVASYAEKRAAEETVKRVLGVRGVAADIEVRLPGEGATKDDEISQRALQLLAWHTSVPAERIEVTVEGGWVTLTGKVSWQFQRAAAEEAVRNLPGVVGVRDNISLSSQSQLTDVKKRIEDAFKRSAELEGQEIRVSVAGDTVTLEGTVDSWSARTHAEAAAWAAPGVCAVRNELLVLVLRHPE